MVPWALCRHSAEFLRVPRYMISYGELYVWKTRVSLFYIAEIGGRFHPVFRDESLGSYHNPPRRLTTLLDGTRSRCPADSTRPKLAFPTKSASGGEIGVNSK